MLQRPSRDCKRPTQGSLAAGRQKVTTVRTNPPPKLHASFPSLEAVESLPGTPTGRPRLRESGEQW